MSGPAASAVIAAAGLGERLGAGGPKALVELAGRPLLRYSLDACRESGSVETIVVAAPPGYEVEVERLLGEANLGHAQGSAVVVGGASRAESVRAALEPVETEIVIVHDAARPLVTAGLLDAVVATLDSRPDAAGAIAAAPLTDTVKLAREARPRGGGRPRGAPTIERTLSRDHLWAAQTPQAFRTRALRDAQEDAAASGALAATTDEAMLLERAGAEVLICKAPAENLKVTTGLDLRLATALLRRDR